MGESEIFLGGRKVLVLYIDIKLINVRKVVWFMVDVCVLFDFLKGNWDM